MTPDISAVVVSWNTRDHLACCLGAIPVGEGLVVEVIVVDNGSTDGSQAMIAEKFPNVRLIQSGENLGFGRASNVGARAGRGRAVLLLNSDCELTPGALGTMMAALDVDSSIGAVVCRLVNTDGTLQPSIHDAFPTPWSLLGDVFFLSSLRYAIYRAPGLHRWLLRSTYHRHEIATDVAWAGAACVLVRRSLFDALGGFDERFFMYCEDMDLCKQIRDGGYTIRYVPEAAAVHHWGRSTAQRPSAMLEAASRSRIHYFEKHFPGWGGPVARALTATEMRVRYAVFSALALVPSRHRASLRARATSSLACLTALTSRADPRRVGICGLFWGVLGRLRPHGGRSAK